MSKTQQRKQDAYQRGQRDFKAGLTVVPSRVRGDCRDRYVAGYLDAMEEHDMKREYFSKMSFGGMLIKLRNWFLGVGG